MSQALQIGTTIIPYEVRFSDRARKKRIVVKPDHVEVVAPAGTVLEGKGGVFSFVEEKRRWMFDAVLEVGARHRRLLKQRYASGAKLQYRGRWLMLVVEPADVESVAIRCRSKFHVEVPRGLSGEARLNALQSAFDEWLHRRAQLDLERFGKRHQDRLGVESKGLRLSDAKARWGSLGRDKVIRVHWRLIQAPAAAMEYVVAHEMVHIVHRNHSPVFWRTLERTMPDWAERKRMLEAWEGERRGV